MLHKPDKVILIAELDKPAIPEPEPTKVTKVGYR
jgi:hypothetical protein